MLSNLRMIERGCSLHRLKDKDDLLRNQLWAVFKSSPPPATRASPGLGREDWRSGFRFRFFLGGKRSQNLELRFKKQRAGNTLRSWNKGKESQIRTPWPGSFDLGPEVRILRLGSRNKDPRGRRITWLELWNHRSTSLTLPQQQQQRGDLPCVSPPSKGFHIGNGQMLMHHFFWA